MQAMNGKIVIVGGAGYWGKNLVRVAIDNFGVNHVIAVDVPQSGLAHLAEDLASQNILKDTDSLQVSTSLDEVLIHEDCKYFVIATPPAQHHDVAMKVLSHRRNLMITKPIALSVKESQEISTFAKKQGVTAMVDHTFLFHPAVVAMINTTKAGAIGIPKTFYADWLSRGKIQDGADVIWDLAPHPLSILLNFWDFPIEIKCTVMDAVEGVTAEASLWLKERRTGNTAIINISWLESNKSRTFRIRGSHNTIIFDDTQDTGAKLKIKGGKAYGHPLLYEGYEKPIHNLDYLQEETVPFDWKEPLKDELKTFIKITEQPDSIEAKLMTNSIDKGIACVRLIEAAEKYIQKSTTEGGYFSEVVGAEMKDMSHEKVIL